MALEDWTVEEWLEKAGLSEWAMAFNDNGYDTPELCATLSAEALDEIGVKNKMHREALFSQASILMEAMKERQKGLSSSGEAAYPMYSEPWNSASDVAGKPQSLPAAGFRPYSEPWNERGVGIDLGTDGMATHNAINGSVPKPVLNIIPSGVDKTDGSSAPVAKTKRKISGEKVKGPVKPSRQRGPKLPISPTLPPAPYQEGTLTKLQLKLKIREELQKDRMILSEPPYCLKDGTVNEPLLVSLAEEYAKRFHVDDLSVYDALKEYWKNLANKSTFVTPAAVDEADSLSKPLHLTSKLSPPDTNYDEPFDAKSGYSRPPPPPLLKASSHEGDSQDEEKSRTLPANGFQTSNYDEPFDSVLSSPQHTPDATSASSTPKHKGKPKLDTIAVPKMRSQIKAHGLGSEQQEEDPISPGSTSPKSKHFWRFGRKRDPKKSRSHSVRQFDVVKKKSKYGPALPAMTKDDSSFFTRKRNLSAEDLVEDESAKNSRPNRTSLPVYQHKPPPLPPNHPGRDGSDSTSTGSDDSPRAPKRNGRQSHSPPMNRLGTSPPLRHRERLRSDSDTEMEKSASLRRVGKVCTTADLEEGSPESKLALMKSQSYDELRIAVDTCPDAPVDKDRRKSHKHQRNFLTKFIKKVSSTTKPGPHSKRTTKSQKNRSSTTSEGLVSSMSMPDIVSGSVNLRSNMTDSEGHLMTPDVGYAEVFDAVKQNTTTPRPRKPPRQQRNARSPLVSPDVSPPMHRRMIIKSSPSVSSSTDHLIIPIHTGSAPIAGYMDQARGSGDARRLGRSPEPDEDLKFSDSDDVRSERTESIESRTTNSSTHSHSRSHNSLNQESLAMPGDSRPPQTDDAISYDSRRSSTESAKSTSADQSGTLTRKPLPPPKPKKSLTLGKRRSPVAAPRQTSVPETKSAKESPKVVPRRGGGGGGGESGSVPVKPPPKPARSKYRSMKIEGVITDGRFKEMNGDTDVKRLSLPKGTSSTGQVSPKVGPRPAVGQLEKSGSEGNLLQTRLAGVAGETLGSTGSLPSTPDSSHTPRPMPRPRPVRPPRAKTATGSLVLERLMLGRLREEGIDLTEEPYTNTLGEGYIPYPLITRYADEQGHSVEKVAKTMEEARGKELTRLAREYKPQDASSLRNRTHPSVKTVDDLLVSAGLPMYRDLLKRSGYATMSEMMKLTDTDLERLKLPPKHRQILLRAIQYHIVL